MNVFVTSFLTLARPRFALLESFSTGFSGLSSCTSFISASSDSSTSNATSRSSGSFNARSSSSSSSLESTTCTIRLFLLGLALPAPFLTVIGFRTPPFLFSGFLSCGVFGMTSSSPEDSSEIIRFQRGVSSSLTGFFASGFGEGFSSLTLTSAGFSTGFSTGLGAAGLAAPGLFEKNDAIELFPVATGFLASFFLLGDTLVGELAVFFGGDSFLTSAGGGGLCFSSFTAGTFAGSAFGATLDPLAPNIDFGFASCFTTGAAGALATGTNTFTSRLSVLSGREIARNSWSTGMFNFPPDSDTTSSAYSMLDTCAALALIAFSRFSFATVIKGVPLESVPRTINSGESFAFAPFASIQRCSTLTASAKLIS
uniref:(northern house mosquito) hypothetical protein n=1 Tax=Culex pipiens TaxID=7175 RepID=A0A8D8DZI3_CULPI